MGDNSQCETSTRSGLLHLQVFSSQELIAKASCGPSTDDLQQDPVERGPALLQCSAVQPTTGNKCKLKSS